MVVVGGIVVVDGTAVVVVDCTVVVDGTAVVVVEGVVVVSLAGAVAAGMSPPLPLQAPMSVKQASAIAVATFISTPRRCGWRLGGSVWSGLAYLSFHLVLLWCQGWRVVLRYQDGFSYALQISHKRQTVSVGLVGHKSASCELPAGVIVKSL